jgi:hypothetical protein
VDGHAEPRRARVLEERREVAVWIAPTAGARAGDVDADDPARRVADRLLDDDLVQPLVERPVHHQDQAGAHLWVLETRAVEAAQKSRARSVEIGSADETRAELNRAQG